MDRDARTRALIEGHWAASDRGDVDTEHAIYAADATLEYPQSGERFLGRSKIRRSAAGTRPNATSASCGSGVWATCG